MRSSVLIFTSLLSVAAIAQQSGATLSGTVLCADTNAPARFARVMLKPAAVDTAAVEQQIRMFTSSFKPSDQERVGPKRLEQIRRDITQSIYTSQQARTIAISDIDGHYIITGIAPGVYFLHVELPGYKDPVNQYSFEEATSVDPEVRARIAQQVPMIAVMGTEQERIDLRIERGSSLSGRVLFDDGSPAADWDVTLLMPRKAVTPLDSSSLTSLTSGDLVEVRGYGTSARTDDLGQFRLSGLAAGTYVIRAQLNAMSPGRNASRAWVHLSIYGGNAFHIPETKPLSLAAGQIREGEELIVPLHSLHKLRGRITAKSDGHSINSGRISVVGKEDPTITADTSLNDDGSFEIYALPPGSYEITVDGAADTRVVEAGGSAGHSASPVQPVHRFGSATGVAVVGDADNTDTEITVPDQ